VIILVSVWAVSSALPWAAAGSPVWGLVDAHIAPMAVLVAIASDRPDAAVDPKRSEHHGAVPAVISVEAGTRSALIHLVRAASLPGSLTGISRLASDLVRRGPPLSFAA
jgi:hypothetical protein